MKISKFQAANMREAVAKVKQELGPDAMVVSTRQIRRGLLGSGVEVTAAIDDTRPPRREPEAPPRQTNAGLSEQDVERIMAPLRSELRSLRTLMRASSDHRQTEELRRELHAMRVALSPKSNGQPALTSVARRSQIACPSKGRVVAVVGPTGVGKTTSIAKLAARSSLIAGESVALVTLDTYRIGGEEQIRTFADLIGVPLLVVADPETLGQQIRELGDYDRIYIDTAGRSPRDTPAIQQLRDALGEVFDIEVHLALAAATRPDTMDSIYQRFSGIQIDRLLMTKLDEADDLSELVRTPDRLKTPISHITTGQAVPEDIEDASSTRLLEIAEIGLQLTTQAA